MKKLKNLIPLCRVTLRQTLACCLLITSTLTAGAQIYINEIMAANTSSYLDPTGNYGGWIELYNAGEKSVTINYWYISDDPAEPKKFRLPYSSGNTIAAGGYHIIWFDHNDLDANHVKFKLDCDGTTLYLSDSNGETVATALYPYAVQGTSYARTTDGGDNWQTCITPTQGASNNNATFGGNRCPAPECSLPSGLYSGTQQLQVSIPEGTTLRYTTDGSEPTELSTPSADGRFTIEETTILRLRLFADGYIPGPIVTRSFIRKEREYTLPIISVVTDSKNLFDNYMGIYTGGLNGITGNGSGDTPRNWNCDWSRPASVEFIDHETEEYCFGQDCEIAIAGGWSRGWAQKSLTLNAEKKFDGKNRFDFPLFVSKPNIRLKHILLRNAGNDNTTLGGSMMKDAAIQSLVAGVVDVEYQAYQPAVHYINGEYYGIINIRERNNKQHVYSNHGYDEEEIDLFEMHSSDAYSQLCGDKAAYTRLKILSRSAAKDNYYKLIRDVLDIDEFLNYVSIELYINNWDWPQNNLKGFRHKDNGKFRFILYDTEEGFKAAENNTFNTFKGKQYYDFSSGAGTEIEFVTIFLNLLENETFKRKFVDRFCLVNGSVFAPDRVAAVVDSLADKVRTEMNYHQQRWGGWGFENGVNNLKNFATQRPTYAYGYLQSFLGLDNPQHVSLTKSHPRATIYVNDEPLPLEEFDGKLFPPITLRAEAPTGYTFDGWYATNNATETLIGYGETWSYYDQGSLDGHAWQSEDYSASGWASGTAPLGYGKTSIVTTVGYGSNANAKNPTTYFRKTFTLDETPVNDDTYSLTLGLDDGAVVYVNNTEVGRYLMPSGTVSYSTYATTYAPGDPAIASFNIPVGLLKKGENLLAVEVHQNSGTSSDIYIDAELTRQGTQRTSEAYAEEAETELPTTGDFTLRAYFSPIPAETETVRPTVCINEASAANNIYVNETFKQNDWIELYNPGDEPVDIAGMYLSDDPEKLHKYQIPTDTEINTTISGHGYYIIWCDKLPDDVYLHANFKLDADGGQVFLSKGSRDAWEWTDTLTYTQHGGAFSMGRYPDGSGNIYLMNRPSMGSTNIYSSYNELLADILATSIPGVFTDEATGSTLPRLTYSYADQTLHYTMTTTDAIGGRTLLTVHNTAGACLMNQPLTGENGIIDTQSLPAGWYVAMIRTADGKRTVCKFVKP